MKTLLILILLAGTAHAQCGTERTDVKQLSDKDTLFLSKPYIESTIASEIKIKVPKVGNHTPRMVTEEQLVNLSVTITGYKLEADQDFHIVISDGQHTMIAEMPNPTCTMVKGSSRFQQMKAVREWFVKNIGTPNPKMKKCKIAVRIGGARFFDRVHGQTGHAANGVEIHPVLAIAK